MPATKRFFVWLEQNALVGVRRAKRHREGEGKRRLILHREPAAQAASVTGTGAAAAHPTHVSGAQTRRA